MYKDKINSIKSVKRDKTLQMCKTCFPASTGESKFCLPANWGMIDQRCCKGKKTFPIVVLVTAELDDPPAKKHSAVFDVIFIVDVLYRLIW